MAIFGFVEREFMATAIDSSIAIILAVLTYFIANEFVRYRARLKGIPGPTGLPIIGNLYQV